MSQSCPKTHKVRKKRKWKTKGRDRCNNLMEKQVAGVVIFKTKGRNIHALKPAVCGERKKKRGLSYK